MLRNIKVFASHDWGVDGANHKRVGNVVKELRSKGIDVWFDESHMKGNILNAMCRGIDESDVILVFVTNSYIGKVNGRNEADNVRREFMYASQYSEKMLPIYFDTTLPAKWMGPVGMLLGSRLYTDLSTISDRSVDTLVTSIKNCTPAVKWKSAARKAKTTTKSPVEVKKDTTTIRYRVQRIAQVHGLTMPRDGTPHSVDTIHRLLTSIASNNVDTSSWGLVEKIEWIEKQLKIA